MRNLHRPTARPTLTRITLLTLALAFAARFASAQATFDVATIRPSAESVKYERNGTTQFAFGNLRMHDVTVGTCIELAYRTSDGLISGPPSLRDVHYDIIAKTEAGTSQEQMRLMMRTLLTDRFHLAFHQEKREMRVFTLVPAKTGIKMHPATPGGEMQHENSATGMTAHSITIAELADYLSDPLGSPLVDGTGLPGRYDLKIDFTPYVDMEHGAERADPTAVLKAALKGELGLEMEQRKQIVEVIVVDRVEAPSEN